jgi:hypothetical protein
MTVREWPADAPRLGPPSIPPGQAPGGVVLHVYDLAGTCVLVRPLVESTTDTDVDADAQTARAWMADHPGALVVVVYDGDTGERGMPG